MSMKDNHVLFKLKFGILILLLTANIKLFGQNLPDLSYVGAVLTVPELTVGEPKAGLRVKQTIPGWENTKVHHIIYLPIDWKPGNKYPTIVEFAVNGLYLNKYGDVSKGTVDGNSLGYGLSKGKRIIWICLPFIDIKKDSIFNSTKWWGDVEETKNYLNFTLKKLSENYGADLNNVVLAGYFRGAIACNYLGLYDDQIAKLWKAFSCHSHYDGVKENWPDPFADRQSAMKRILRLKNRSQWISQEGSTQSTQEYLKNIGIKGQFTFKDIPLRNHSDS